ncbi:MAG: type I methionyl aminopeptidase [Acidimicrobiales bacterium]
MRRTEADIAIMRKAGRVVAEMHAVCRDACRPGATTADLDRAARGVLAKRGARSNFLGYGRPPFPAVICASVNDEVVHGIPGTRVLEEGDIVSIDCGAIVQGWHGDAAITVPVGNVAPAAQRLIEVTERSLTAGIAALVDGGRLHDVGAAVQRVVEGAGLGVVRDYVGHAIGTAMHESPEVPNYWPGTPGPRLRVGHVFAVEPMVTAGSPDTVLDDDGWTVKTADGGLAAHSEHTIAITAHGPEILTLP